MSVLEVHDVAVSLAGRQVLRDVNLQVNSGDFVGLLGPNGAGKTTLLRSILGLVPITAGAITVAGGTVRRGRSGIGYVPQRHEFAWDFPIDVEQVVMTGRNAQLRRLRPPQVHDWRAVADAVDRVELTPLSRRPVGQLSGGQRQRVLIARALASESTVLLLDEPFTGLDMPSQESLTRLLQGLAGEGHGVLMTTHDVAGAMHACDQLALLNRTILRFDKPSRLRDPKLWMDTFAVSASNPLLRVVEVA